MALTFPLIGKRELKIRMVALLDIFFRLFIPSCLGVRVTRVKGLNKNCKSSPDTFTNHFGRNFTPNRTRSGCQPLPEPGLWEGPTRTTTIVTITPLVLLYIVEHHIPNRESFITTNYRRQN